MQSASSGGKRERGGPGWKLRSRLICVNDAAVAGYELATVETAASATDPKQLGAGCPAGKTTTGLGWSVLDSTGAILDGRATFAGLNGASWLTNARNLSGFAATWKLRLQAICTLWRQALRMPSLAYEDDDGRPCVLLLSEQDVQLGRTPDCTILFQSETVTRRHARIVYRDHGYCIVDLKSDNGTWVNGQRVTSHRLQPNDVIQCGSTSCDT